jgi:hypothetical protein
VGWRQAGHHRIGLDEAVERENHFLLSFEEIRAGRWTS